LAVIFSSSQQWMDLTMKNVALGLAALALVAVATPALAQRWEDRDRGRGGGGGIVELYSLPGFQGERRTFSYDIANLADTGFNDRAQSVRIRGRGEVQFCQDKDFRSRCVVLSSDEPDLNRIGFASTISSLRRPYGDWGSGGGWGDDDWRRGRDDWGRGGGSDRADATGRTAAFFARPSVNGEPLSASCGGGWGGGNCAREQADQFCRRQGYRGSAYAATGRSRFGEALEDVLCVR
jgi:hypothetical protein